MKQKDAVYGAITTVLGTTTFPSQVNLDRDSRNKVATILIDGFNQGTIELTTQQEDIKKYVSNLINNWIRKDARLNGGSKYAAAQSTGTRTKKTDPVVLNLMKLKEDPNLSEQDRAALEAEITKRVQATSSVVKKTKKAVNMDALPQDLKDKLGPILGLI